MEHYKTLGIDENASMEEVTRAYKNKVNKFKEEINSERRAKAFIKVFDEAYEAIKKEREQDHYKQNLEVETNYRQLDHNSKHHSNEDKYDDFEYDEEEYIVDKKSRRASSKNSSRKKQRINKKKSWNSNSKDRDKNKRDKDKKASVKGKKESSTVSQMIVKILAIPLIVVLSTIIFFCKIISLISWIASKIIIVAAIALSAIHGYQIYMGQPIQYKIFIISGVAFVISLFLPSILKIVPSMLEGLNHRLKRFVF